MGVQFILMTLLLGTMEGNAARAQSLLTHPQLEAVLLQVLNWMVFNDDWSFRTADPDYSAFGIGANDPRTKWVDEISRKSVDWPESYGPVPAELRVVLVTAKPVEGVRAWLFNTSMGTLRSVEDAESLEYVGERGVARDLVFITVQEHMQGASGKIYALGILWSDLQISVGVATSPTHALISEPILVHGTYCGFAF